MNRIHQDVRLLVHSLLGAMCFGLCLVQSSQFEGPRLPDNGEHLSYEFEFDGIQGLSLHIFVFLKGKGKEKKKVAGHFNDDTPLSVLFREGHHEELRKRIELWRPYLIGVDASVNALNLTDFQFDFTAIRPVSIYMNLAHLVNLDALRPPMSVLAAYMFEHSNLSRSKNALYVQLKRYRKMSE